MTKRWLMSFIAFLLLLLSGIGYIIVYGSNSALPKGFQLPGMNVEGVAPDSALEQIHKRISELEATLVTVTIPTKHGTNDTPSHSSRTLEQLGMHIDAEEAIKAIELFRDTSIWKRALIRYQQRMNQPYGIKVFWDEKKFQAEARTAWGSAAGVPPKNAVRIINEYDEVVYTPETIGTTLDLASLFVSIKTYAPKSLAPIPGQGHRSIKLPVIRTAPDVTMTSLKEEGIDRKIIAFTTSFETSGEGRTHNVIAAAKALNDTLLMPDAIFEYGKIVEHAEKEYGYKEAPVILKGKLTPGIGGGICQVSSTLYNAALLAGLEIVERRNHSLVVSYLPKGLDATYADGYINFKFRNTTGKQLLIRTVVEDKKLTVKLFGTMPEDVTYRTETIQVKEIPVKIVYIPSQKLTLGKQLTQQQGAPGYVVEAYLMKLIDEQVVDRKRVSRDTYRSQDTVIAVNENDPRLLPARIESTPDPTASPEGKTEGPLEPL
jgi:vancomycin resistance protein YoaR